MLPTFQRVTLDPEASARCAIGAPAQGMIMAHTSSKVHAMPRTLFNALAYSPVCHESFCMPSPSSARPADRCRRLWESPCYVHSVRVNHPDNLDECRPFSGRDPHMIRHLPLPGTHMRCPRVAIDSVARPGLRFFRRSCAILCSAQCFPHDMQGASMGAVPVITVTGWSNSGKTTFVTHVVGLLTDMGVRVGVITGTRREASTSRARTRGSTRRQARIRSCSALRTSTLSL